MAAPKETRLAAVFSRCPNTMSLQAALYPFWWRINDVLRNSLHKVVKCIQQYFPRPCVWFQPNIHRFLQPCMSKKFFPFFYVTTSYVHFTGHWVCMVSLLWRQKRMQSNYLSALYPSMQLVTIKLRLQISRVHHADSQSLLRAAAWGWQTLQYPCFVNVCEDKLSAQSAKKFFCCKAEKIPLPPSELKVPASLCRLEDTK